MEPRTAARQQALIDGALRGELTEAQARQLYDLGPEAVVLVALATSRHIAEQNARIAQLQSAAGTHPSPATPSGQMPVYSKPNRSQRRQRKPGARAGHPGARRRMPTKIDERQNHRLESCPHCAGRVQRCERSRTRIIEDIPVSIQPVVTEHTLHRDYCPRCKKHVEPVVPDAMPGAALGHRVIVLTAWFHYGLGLTIDQVVQLLAHHLQTEITPGGLIDAWRRLAEVIDDWYEQIGAEARNSAHLHADETGWRVNGRTHWLWCFTNERNCYYMIDRSRGSPALQKFFAEAFDGVLITDFWSPYLSVSADDRQYCLVHLLRELEKVDLTNESDEWRAFAKRLRRLIRDGIRLRKRSDFTPQRYADRAARLNTRLAEMAVQEPEDPDARRLTNRLRRYAEYVFTFLDYEHVPFENNFAERQIRPAVILRKNSQSNRSDRGAATQAVMMSVFRTLRLRGLDPTRTLVNALQTYVTTSQLPPLPDAAVADG